MKITGQHAAVEVQDPPMPTVAPPMVTLQPAQRTRRRMRMKVTDEGKRGRQKKR